MINDPKLNLSRRAAEATMIRRNRASRQNDITVMVEGPDAGFFSVMSHREAYDAGLPITLKH